VIGIVFTYRNIIAAGAVNTPPSKKNAPGNVFSVALYTALYIGPYNNGTKASQTPNIEFTFPEIVLTKLNAIR
jgi:hypothetical protein